MNQALAEKGLKNFRLVNPYTFDQKGKINILAEETDDLDYYTSAALNRELEIITSREDINLLIEGDLEDYAIQAYKQGAVDFNRQIIDELYKKQFGENYNVDHRVRMKQ